MERRHCKFSCGNVFSTPQSELLIPSLPPLQYLSTMRLGSLPGMWEEGLAPGSEGWSFPTRRAQTLSSSTQVLPAQDICQPGPRLDLNTLAVAKHLNIFGAFNSGLSTLSLHSLCPLFHSRSLLQATKEAS